MYVAISALRRPEDYTSDTYSRSVTVMTNERALLFKSTLFALRFSQFYLIFKLL